MADPGRVNLGRKFSSSCFRKAKGGKGLMQMDHESEYHQRLRAVTKRTCCATYSQVFCRESCSPKKLLPPLLLAGCAKSPLNHARSRCDDLVRTYFRKIFGIVVEIEIGLVLPKALTFSASLLSFNPNKARDRIERRHFGAQTNVRVRVRVDGNYASLKDLKMMQKWGSPGLERLECDCRLIVFVKPRRNAMDSVSCMSCKEDPRITV